MNDIQDVYMVKFSVSNYTCFGNKTTLDLCCDENIEYNNTLMLPQGELNRISKIKVAPICLVSGKNASGKTRMLSALSAMCETVVRNPYQPVFSASKRQHNYFRPDLAFHFDENYQGKPIRFEITLSVSGLWYNYGFEIEYRTNKYELEKEWLSVDAETLKNCDDPSRVLTYSRIRTANGLEIEKIRDWMCVCPKNWRDKLNFLKTLSF